MNVSKVISTLRATRKLLPISVNHQSAEPSIQLSNADFDALVPFMKALFKAFDKNGYTLHISRWGEVYLHSLEIGVGVLLKLEEKVIMPNKELLHNLKVQGYQLIDMPQREKSIVLKYRFTETKTKWRSIVIEQKPAALMTVEEYVLGPILDISRQFKNRVNEVPVDIIEGKLTIDDISAISGFGAICQPNLRAIRGIHYALCRYNLSNYQITESGITFEGRWQPSEISFNWQKNDIAFLNKYCPDIFHT
tara:strand:+ start:33305 stop:34054 length:750 start_codon:yes stop_codon:yes gene_type:complete